MRVALTNPFVWPHVRRGSERLLNDLGAHLGARGHDVTVHAMAPEAAVEWRASVTYRLLRQRRAPSWRQFNACHRFAFDLQRALANDHFDAVFCLNYFDAYAALRARRKIRGRFRVVFQAVGIPTRRYFRAVPLDAWFMREVLAGCDAVLVLSAFAQSALERDFGRRAAVVPPPVDVTAFALPDRPEAAPAKAPMILFVGDVDEPRKGARALCRAFARVREQGLHAELVFAGRVSGATRDALLGQPGMAAAGEHIRFLGLGEVDDLPALYRAAALTVLPSVWEAFGLVLVESLACGTPVVGARHGGIPDIVADDRVGRLFDPGSFGEQTENDPGLARAILEVLQQGKPAAVRAACRARAECFGWNVLGPAYEQVLTKAEGIGPVDRAAPLYDPA